MTLLKQRGYRATPQRVELLKIIAASDGHPSATQIYERIQRQFPTTTLATVYKTLTLLKGMGEVLELEFSGAENRYDGNNPTPHLHLICVNCHRVTDSEIDVMSDLPNRVARATGYEIVGQRFDLYGLCLNCQSKGRTAAKNLSHPKTEERSKHHESS